MKYFDISIPISNTMHCWPSDQPVSVTFGKTIEQGASSNVTNLNLNTHTGTHIDAPYHMISDGHTVDNIPLDILLGEVQIIEISNPWQIELAELSQKYQPGIERVILKTRNSTRWNERVFFADFVHLLQEAAAFLVEQKVKLVGIDYLSIDKYGDKQHQPHKTLLGNNIVIVDGLNLSEVSTGVYQLCCLPLKIADADGAPCRAVLARDK